MSFISRRERLVQEMKAEGLDALLIVSPSGTCYLSGCFLLTQTVIPEREAYVLLTSDGDISYLVCNLEEASAYLHSQITDIRTYIEFAEIPADAAARLLEAKGLENGRIGFEYHAISAFSFSCLQINLPDANFVPWGAQFRKTVMIKDQAEVAALQKAGQATQKAIEQGLTQASPSSSELDISNRIMQGIMDAGIVPLFNVLAAGPNILETHGVATNRILQEGEIVRLDMGGRDSESHFLSDMARTAVVGTPSIAQETIYAALADIQLTIMNACTPGKPISSLFELCISKYAEHKLPFLMPHIGHGLGIELHEAPIINAKNQTPLTTGMVLNIEPFVAIPERTESYHIEDLVLVTEGNPIFLTTPSSELIRIPT